MYDFYPHIDIRGTGENLREMTRRRGLGVRDIQYFLGLSSAKGIYHWFEGRNLPSLDNLYALSRLLDVPMDMLIKRSDPGFRSFRKENMARRLLRYYEISV